MSETTQIILTSSLIAAVLSAIVSALVSIKLKNLDYKNEYYKKILEKRLEAYKFIETQIAVLKISTVREDGKPFCIIFSYGNKKFHEFQNNLHTAIMYGMWMGNSTNELMEKLNVLFFQISNEIGNMDGDDLMEVGKEYYNEISSLRSQLEQSVKHDLINLHDIKQFRKQNRRPETRKIEMNLSQK